MQHGWACDVSMQSSRDGCHVHHLSVQCLPSLTHTQRWQKCRFAVAMGIELECNRKMHPARVIAPAYATSACKCISCCALTPCYSDLRPQRLNAEAHDPTAELLQSTTLNSGLQSMAAPRQRSHSCTEWPPSCAILLGTLPAQNPVAAAEATDGLYLNRLPPR